MKKLFLSAGALVAGIPGVGILITGSAAPPGRQIWYGATLETVSVATVLLIFIFKPRIVQWSSKKASLIALALGGLAAILLTIYFILYKWCVVSVSSHGTVFYPLWTTGDLKETLVRQGSRAKALEHYGEGWIDGLIEEAPLHTIVVTDIVLLGTLLMGTTSLVVMFLILGMHTHPKALSSRLPKPSTPMSNP